MNTPRPNALRITLFAWLLALTTMATTTVLAQDTASAAAEVKSSPRRVVVRTLVDGNGAVQATQIRESSGNSRLDEEAMQVVTRSWKFSPLKINGKGVEVWVNVPINFVQATPAPAPDKPDQSPSGAAVDAVPANGMAPASAEPPASAAPGSGGAD